MTFLWLPLLAIAAHLVEEFVWPGGFAAWYRAYPPGRVVVVSPRLLVWVNVVFVALALLPLLLGPTPQGYAYWVVVVSIAGANGLFHLWATMRARRYSPGVVTGALLYLPLAIGGTTYLWHQRLVAATTVLQALAIAVAYTVWSSWNHRRHTSAVVSADDR
jgi:hypothetical protein